MTSVSIAIPTFGRDEVLIETLRHVLNLDPRADEVLVIDQTPRHDEATERQLDSWSRDGAIRLLQLDRPSIPHAMNEALRQAAGKVVLYLDDDVIPSRDLVARYRVAIESQDADAVIGQVLQPGEVPVPLPDRNR